MSSSCLCRVWVGPAIPWTIAHTAAKLQHSVAIAMICLPLGNHRLWLVVGDASGKGVAAALMIASVQSSLQDSGVIRGKRPGQLT